MKSKQMRNMFLALNPTSANGVKSMKDFGKPFVKYQFIGLTPYSELLFWIPLKMKTSSSGQSNLFQKNESTIIAGTTRNIKTLTNL